MLVNYLGEDNFKNGLRNYLNHFKYKNAKTKDLWDYLSSASKKDVNKVMNSWTTKMGYPIVSVKEEPNNMLKISQKKYGSVKDTEDINDYIWCVPLNIDLYPNSPQCFPLNRSVSIFFYPCRPFEPNHVPLSNSLRHRFFC